MTRHHIHDDLANSMLDTAAANGAAVEAALAEKEQVRRKKAKDARKNNANRQYEGGYYVTPVDLIHGGFHSHTAALDAPISEETLRALDAIQGTAYRINTTIVEIAWTMYQERIAICGIPDQDDIKLPPRMSDADWEAMEPEAKKEYKKKMADIHAKNAARVSQRLSFDAKVRVAIRMSAYPEIFFPHFLDFRTRIYPIPQDLHPQSDDIARSFLMYAQGKRLGKAGVKALMIRLANNAGWDKLSRVDKILKVKQHHAEIMDSARDPLDGQRWWCAVDKDGEPVADEPFNLLASCMEYAAAMESGNPEDFVSYLPCPMDGSCNGLQHLSGGLGRDRRGAIKTNCAANEKREDIYEEVRTIVNRLVSADALAGMPEAQAWVGKVTRTVVKRAVMTTPYGVTERGIRDQLVKDGHVKSLGLTNRELGKNAAEYLRDKIVEALSETVVAAKSIMLWIQTVAKELAEAGRPLEWTTPVGNKIRQSYWNVRRQVVNTLLGQVVLWNEDEELGLSVRKQCLASAPNMVHSFDAAHAVRSVNAFVDALLARGEIAYVTMIHDSYACHAADYFTMARVLREEFVRIYSDCWLDKLEQEIRSKNPDVNITPWSAVIEMGDFDVTEVLDSEFFFS